MHLLDTFSAEDAPRVAECWSISLVPPAVTRSFSWSWRMEAERAKTHARRAHFRTTRGTNLSLHLLDKLPSGSL